MIDFDPQTYQPPFPYFGGKSRIADLVWTRLGSVPNFIEPFFGSGAVLFRRPPAHLPATETVNDKNGWVSNFWRAVQSDPEAVAHYADWPVSEIDLHARHDWLMNTGRERLTEVLRADPEAFDAKLAGWWCWGMCCWIGSGWCDEKALKKNGDTSPQIPLLVAGSGVNRPFEKIPHLDVGRGSLLAETSDRLEPYFASISERLRRVRVCYGDWERICGDTPTIHQGLTGVFLDPPYSAEAGREAVIYAEEDLHVAHRVREWAIPRGDDPRFRIALCGYEGEHDMPDSWECVVWKARGGYAKLGAGKGWENRRRERIWFSPHCLKAHSLATLWDTEGVGCAED